MQFVNFQGKKVAYRIQGKGQTLVLLHGLCEDSTIWDDFIKNLSDYRIIRPDLSGFGGSEILPAHSIEMMADSIKVLLDELKVTQCVMVGHSMGGYVTMAFAKKYPSVLKGVGLFHSHPFEDTEEKKEERRKGIEFVKRNGHIIYVKQLIPKLFAELFATSNEFLINSLIHKATQYQPQTIIGAQEAMLNRPDCGDVLKNLHCPALLIIGKQDKTVPYPISLQMLPLAATSEILILPKVAHMGIFTARDRIVKTIKHFMELCHT
ncbi:MAG: alpha/beta hydrolase [Saprospiraceae bacterium]|nr:alpha/beta hydrolase [Saprospiraceae bacterium]